LRLTPIKEVFGQLLTISFRSFAVSQFSLVITKCKQKPYTEVAFGTQAALVQIVMDIILSFFGSLAEPTRLALVGGILITGALLLRKLLLGTASLREPAKADASAK
jgi:hypothetical protein